MKNIYSNRTTQVLHGGSPQPPECTNNARRNYNTKGQKHFLVTVEEIGQTRSNVHVHAASSRGDVLVVAAVMMLSLS